MPRSNKRPAASEGRGAPFASSAQIGTEGSPRAQPVFNRLAKRYTKEPTPRPAEAGVFAKTLRKLLKELI